MDGQADPSDSPTAASHEVAPAYAPIDYLAEPQRQDVVRWLRLVGFVVDGPTLAIAWSKRSGIDCTELIFYPLNRHAGDVGWEAIVGQHASGTNPRMAIGTCETLADVQMVFSTLRLINGYKEPEPMRISASWK